MSSEDYPVAVNDEGIKLKTEKMVQDQLYHCIYDDKVYLFYKDELGLLHCYEVEDSQAVAEIKKDPAKLEEILKKHSESK
ncbi:MAG: hypothetical protein DA330_03240 [Nitrososphaera sp.]|nr:hypothetical protein [Nitrososphaera sp.]